MDLVLLAKYRVQNPFGGTPVAVENVQVVNGQNINLKECREGVIVTIGNNQPQLILGNVEIRSLQGQILTERGAADGCPPELCDKISILPNERIAFIDDGGLHYIVLLDIVSNNIRQFICQYSLSTDTGDGMSEFDPVGFRLRLILKDSTAFINDQIENPALQIPSTPKIFTSLTQLEHPITLNGLFLDLTSGGYVDLPPKVRTDHPLFIRLLECCDEHNDQIYARSILRNLNVDESFSGLFQERDLIAIRFMEECLDELIYHARLFIYSVGLFRGTGIPIIFCNERTFTCIPTILQHHCRIVQDLETIYFTIFDLSTDHGSVADIRIMYKSQPFHHYF